MVSFDKYEKFGDYHWQDYQAGGVNRQHANRVANWIQEDLILDIGAGDGLITSLIGAVGLDDNKTATRLARQHDVDVINASAYSIPFPDESFQSVLLGDVLEHLEDENKALLEIHRVLQESGHLYITTPPARQDGQLHDPLHIREYTQKRLQWVVERCGYKMLESNIDRNQFNIYAKFRKIEQKIARQSLRLLFFTHSSLLGGAERSLIELISQLVGTYHHHCTVILPDQGPSVRQLEALGADTIIAPIHWWCDGFNLPDPQEQARLNAESFCWVLENLDWLQSLDPDVVLTNTMVIPWGAVAAAKLARPHLWMVNEFGEADHGFKFFYPFERVLALIDQASDKIITRSNAIRHTLFPSLSDDKIQTIYRNIQLPKHSREKVASRLIGFTNPDTYRLILTGTIMPTKGQEDAVHSMIELVKNRGLEVELLMIGHSDPDYVQHLNSLITHDNMNNRIQIMPFQEYVIPLVAQADAVLVCSRMEALGRVVLEGLLMKKPVIATNAGGNQEMINDGETGLLYTPGDHIQLADQIEKLMDDQALAEQLVQKGWQFASQTFTEAAFGGAFHQVITELAQQGFRPKEGFQDFIDELTHQALIHKINVEKDLLEKNAQLEQEAVSYTTSKSWRFTRPFRKIKAMLRSKSGD